ncbi:MAG: FAD-binding oxidoreductase [Candidatus Omnitrophota bacterium]|nr:FAD-binding oxidoreductase [Candidatus Omnitrophota bacterium]
MPQEFELKVREIIYRTYNVKSFRMEVGASSGAYRAGQFLLAQIKSRPELKRYLSFSSSPTEAGYIEFTKKVTESEFSQALGRLKPGDSLLIQYPFGKFTLEDNFTKVAFLSGGIGITPIRSICKYAVDKNFGTDIVLVYANRSIEDIVFKEDFDQMQKTYSGLKVAHVLCESAPGFRCSIGRISAGVIKQEVPDYPERKFFLCGPPGMVEAMRQILSGELAVAGANIITENFQGY